MMDATSVYSRMLVHHIEKFVGSLIFKLESFDNLGKEKENDENANTSWQRKVMRYCRRGIQYDAWRHFDWCACVAFFGVEVV